LSITIVDNNPANDPPVNHLPAPITTTITPVVVSLANGNSLFVTDIDAANANNFMVTLTVAQGTLFLASGTGLTVSGNGSVATPLMLTGTLANINAALGSGLFVMPPNGFTGTTSLTIHSDDKGNTGPGGALTDTDTLNITIVDNTPLRVVSVIADSSAWMPEFRDFVDGTFTNPSALGFHIPKGPLQLITLPWVNIDRLKVRFNKDVGSSLSIADFQLAATPGFGAFGIPPGTPPTIQGFSYDASTLTATLVLSKFFPAAVVDLRVTAAGVFDGSGNILDGEWTNGVTLGDSGNNIPGGDFSYRIFVLPGDVLDQSGGSGFRGVNSNDAQRVRDLQNGFALPGFGVFGYDPRVDLNGSNFINSDDSQYERDQQNAIILPLPGAVVAGNLPAIGFGQNGKNRLDVNGDGFVTPIDALLPINVLNRMARGPHGLAAVDVQPAGFLDVSGDNALSPVDALLVINWLNQHPADETASGFEKESKAASVFAAETERGDRGGKRRLDVNRDGSVTPLDALLAINALNAKRSRPQTASSTDRFAEWLDTSGDGELTPLDPLLVINWLNRDSRNPNEDVSPNDAIEFDETLDELALDVHAARRSSEE
jgi:hypothetical protein